jgi:hypothetical protein
MAARCNFSASYSEKNIVILLHFQTMKKQVAYVAGLAACISTAIEFTTSLL